MKAILSFLAFLVFFSCDNRSIPEKRKAILITSNPARITTNLGTGIDLKSLDRLNENTNKVNDTIDVFVNKYRKIYLRNDNTFKMIICENKDTVHINISKNDIKVAFNNKALKKYDTLPLVSLYSKYLKSEISKAKSFKKKVFKKDERTKEISINQRFIDSNQNAFPDYHLILKDITSKSNKILLNVYKQDSISNSYYHYYKSQNDYKEFATLLEAFNFTDDPYLKNQILRYFESDDVIMDDFIGYGYVNRLINDLYIKKRKFDFKKTFDSLPSHISGNVLKYAQLICLREIASTYDRRTFDLYTNRYLGEPNGFSEMQETVKKIDEKYALEPNFLKKKDFQSLQLKDIDGKNLTLAKVLKANVGNIVYIDFWASWCVPCRASMPASKKLRDDYADKDIAFIFISIDTDEEKWDQASEMEDLENYHDNLLATNFPSAKIYKKLDLKSIPRYLLFDSSGKLVNRNAPNPGSDKIKAIIDELLSYD